ncbi:sigma-70 RNA polymerase sigma factor region 4 domain-containing protein [Gemella massiliensis]|uniref:hypothetical protein n=1 Tax=Gemella massiliensis TaxID=1909670 RepID=UPI000AB49105|nr:hypothetical protein [Gemella massiliensis]
MNNNKFNYTKNDVDYYLEAYSKIKRQLNIYVIDKLSSDNDNKSTLHDINTNEAVLVNKLSDYDFEKDRYALDCIDKLIDSLVDVRDKKILQFRYRYKLTIEEVAEEVCYHTRTVERKIQRFKDRLYKMLNDKKV